MTQDELKKLTFYDPESGLFYRKTTGNVVGNYDKFGYCRIGFKGKPYFAHRLAWLYVFGYFPHQLDHKDRNPRHNWISNLRESSQSQNMANIPAKRAGLKGVSRHSNGRSWIAQIKFENRRYYLGSYDTEREAHNAYVAFAYELHGQFACVASS